MLINTQICGPQKLHYWPLRFCMRPLLIALRDDNQRPAGLQDAQDLLQVFQQVGPVILGFNSRDQVELVFGNGS